MEKEQGREVICGVPYCNVIKTKGFGSPSSARAESIKASPVWRYGGILLEGYQLQTTLPLIFYWKTLVTLISAINTEL